MVPLNQHWLVQLMNINAFLRSHIHVCCPDTFPSVIWVDADHQIFASHARRGFWVNANDFLPGCRWTHYNVQKLYRFYVRHNENGAAFENMNLFSEAFEARGTNKREAIMPHSHSQYCSPVSINEDGMPCIFLCPIALKRLICDISLR